MAKESYPVALGQVIFTKICVESINTFNPETTAIISITPDNAINVEKDEVSGLHVATMKCVLNKEKTDQSPYFVDVECIATFTVDGEQIKEENEAKRAVTIIAHSVLYGAIRETVSYITSRQPFGTFTLGLSILTSPKKKDQEE